MKALKSLLVMVLLISMIPVLHAAWAKKVRTRFRAYGDPCWQTGTIHHPDGSSTTVTNNPTYTSTLTSGDFMDVWLDPTCMCGQGPSEIGSSWQESSVDNGASWSLTSGTFAYVYQPSGDYMEEYDLSTNGAIVPANGLKCNP